MGDPRWGSRAGTKNEHSQEWHTHTDGNRTRHPKHLVGPTGDRPKLSRRVVRSTKRDSVTAGKVVGLIRSPADGTDLFVYLFTCLVPHSDSSPSPSETGRPGRSASTSHPWRRSGSRREGPSAPVDVTKPIRPFGIPSGSPPRRWCRRTGLLGRDQTATDVGRSPTTRPPPFLLPLGFPRESSPKYFLLPDSTRNPISTPNLLPAHLTSSFPSSKINVR